MTPNPIQILLVEDQGSHVKLVERAFAEAGPSFQLTIAGTLKEAQYQIEASSPNVQARLKLLPSIVRQS